MEIDTDLILELLVDDNSRKLHTEIDNVIKNDVHSNNDWKEFVNILRVACSKTYQKHWLKTHQIMFSVFEIPELLGIDCDFFNELRAIPQPTSVLHASNSLFDVLIEIAKIQLKTGGSTLFFKIESISSTKSAVITSDLIEARYRETVLVLNEIDRIIPTLTKEWVDVSRLWRTGNGFRLMKATDLGVLIHINEYKEIRKLLLDEMKIDSMNLTEVSGNFGDAEYLLLSETLDKFVTGLIPSRGIRGTYEPHFKTWIDHEGLDEF